MADFKNRKLLINVKEFVKTPESTMYNINGIDLAKAIFFWRLPMGMYDVIPLGFYEIVYEGDNVYLHIIDTTVYEKIESIQICYEFASISSTYDVDFNVDVNTLKDRYNEVVEDMKAIFNYVEKNMMTSDALDVSVVLPQLGKDEVWIKTADGYAGFNIGDIDANIKDFWERFYRETEAMFQKLYDTTEESLDKIITEGDTQDKRVEDEGEFQLNRILIATSEMEKKLQLVWRMYSVITGSNRYLSGNFIVDRVNLDRTIAGGSIANRTGAPRHIYNGNNIANRALQLTGFNIDLGEYK